MKRKKISKQLFLKNGEQCDCGKLWKPLKTQVFVSSFPAMEKKVLHKCDSGCMPASFYHADDIFSF